MRIKVSIGEAASKEEAASTTKAAKTPPAFPYEVGLGCDTEHPPETTRCRYPQRGIFFAEELEPREEITKDLLTGNIPDMPKGRHLQDLLASEHKRETPKAELACVMRFPPDVASILHRRIRLEDAGVPLGLEIQATPLEDYRIYDIRLALYDGDAELMQEIRENDSTDERLCSYIPHDSIPIGYLVMRGILLELPTKVEVYKFLPWNIEDGYKANMLSQMIYVWVPSRESLNIDAFRPTKDWRNQDLVSWYSAISGLTPGSFNISERKFTKNDMYTREELQLAEYQMLEILYSSYRDLLLLETATVWDYVRNLAKLRWELDNPTIASKQRGGLSKIVDILGPDDAMVFQPDATGSWNSDMDSDAFFSGTHFHHRNETFGNNTDNNIDPDVVEHPEDLDITTFAEDFKDDTHDVDEFDLGDFK